MRRTTTKATQEYLWRKAGVCRQYRMQEPYYPQRKWRTKEQKPRKKEKLKYYKYVYPEISWEIHEIQEEKGRNPKNMANGIPLEAW